MIRCKEFSISSTRLEGVVVVLVQKDHLIIAGVDDLPEAESRESTSNDHDAWKVGSRNVHTRLLGEVNVILSRTPITLPSSFP